MSLYYTLISAEQRRCVGTLTLTLNPKPYSPDVSVRREEGVHHDAQVELVHIPEERAHGILALAVVQQQELHLRSRHVRRHLRGSRPSVRQPPGWWQHPGLCWQSSTGQRCSSQATPHLSLAALRRYHGQHSCASHDMPQSSARCNRAGTKPQAGAPPHVCIVTCAGKNHPEPAPETGCPASHVGIEGRRRLSMLMQGRGLKHWGDAAGAGRQAGLIRYHLGAVLQVLV